MSKHFVRSIKNITNRYTSTQITVRNATSNEPWGPSSSELHEIAVLTYHDKYVKEVLEILEKRLDDKGKNWRHVMKALTILLHCIYEGSDTVVVWLKRNLYLIKTLREFRYADEKNIDQGTPIRAKARLITEMIESPEKLAQEKQQYRSVREGMGRPGIVDLATGNSRLTFDMSSSGRPRTSGGGTRISTGTRNSLSANSSSQPTGVTTPENVTSPRSSLDVWTQQSKSGVYSKQKTRPPKSSMEGRYSLSLPLHAIQEESHYGGAGNTSAPKPFPSSSTNTQPSSVVSVNRSVSLKNSIPKLKTDLPINPNPPASAAAVAKIYQNTIHSADNMHTSINDNNDNNDNNNTNPNNNYTIHTTKSIPTIRQVDSSFTPISATSLTSPNNSNNPFLNLLNQGLSTNPHGQHEIFGSVNPVAASSSLTSPNSIPHLASPQPQMLKVPVNRESDQKV